jgi:hypothetical protein
MPPISAFVKRANMNLESEANPTSTFISIISSQLIGVKAFSK